MAAIAAAILAVDQFTKLLVVDAWPPGHAGVAVIPGFFRLVHFRNTGGAWGLLGGFPWFLTAFSIVAVLFIVWRGRWLVEGSRCRAVLIACILGGILGNLVDRLARGEVVDFLLFYLGKFAWPAFNVADSAICVGVFGFVLVTLFAPEKGPASGAEAGTEPKTGA